MEIIFANNDLGLVFGDSFYGISPLANRFKGGFDGFSTTVHGQNLVGTGQLADFSVKRPELLVAKSARCHGQFLGLIRERLQDFRMTMTLVDRGVGRQTIQIAFAVNIPNPNPFAAAQYHIKGFVSLGTVLIFQIDMLK